MRNFVIPLCYFSILASMAFACTKDSDGDSTGTSNGSGPKSSSEMDGSVGQGATPSVDVHEPEDTQPSAQPTSTVTSPEATADSSGSGGSGAGGSGGASHETDLGSAGNWEMDDGGADPASSAPAPPRVDAGSMPAPDSGVAPASSESTVIDGCNVITAMGSGALCVLRLFCDDELFTTSCVNAGDGVSSCTCSNSEFSHQIDLVGVDGVQTCERLARACVEGSVPEFESEFECGPSGFLGGTDACNSKSVCQRNAEFADGLIAVEQVERTTACSTLEGEEGEFHCWCGNEVTQGGADFGLTETLGAEACDMLEEMCWNQVPVALEEWSCEADPEYSIVESDFCREAERCTQPLAVGEATAQFLDTTLVDCQDGEAGPECQCWYPDNSTIAVKPATSIETACSEVLEICDEVRLPQPSATLECDLSGTSTSTERTCGAQWGCTQSGTIGDASFENQFLIWSTCRRQGAEWDCSCSTDHLASVANKVPGTTIAYDACKSSVDTCIAALGTAIPAPNNLPLGHVPVH